MATRSTPRLLHDASTLESLLADPLSESSASLADSSALLALTLALVLGAFSLDCLLWFDSWPSLLWDDPERRSLSDPELSSSDLAFDALSPERALSLFDVLH